MIRPALLQLLIDRHAESRDEAAARAAQARRETSRATGTLETLHGYRRDYDTKAPVMRTQSFAPLLLERHRLFVERLDHAVSDQQGRLRMLEAAAARADADLVEQQRRLKAFETLQTRQRERRERRQARLEQQATDELAMTILRANRARPVEEST